MIEVVMMVMRVVPMMAVMAVLVMMLLMVMPVIMTGTGSTGSEDHRKRASERDEGKLGSTKDNSDSMCTHAFMVRASLVVLMASIGRKMVVLRATYCIFDG